MSRLILIFIILSFASCSSSTHRSLILGLDDSCTIQFKTRPDLTVIVAETDDKLGVVLLNDRGDIGSLILVENEVQSSVKLKEKKGLIISKSNGFMKKFIGNE
jgi:hypothetical protein